MTEHNKAMASAKTDEAKANIKAQKQNATTGLRTCNNILSMTQPLHAKSPSFIGDKKINLSWKEAVKGAPSTATALGGKRPASTTNGSSNNQSKKGRGSGGYQNQQTGWGYEGRGRGGGGRGRGRGWGRHGRGRGY